MRKVICAAVLLLAPAMSMAQQANAAHETFVKVCGECHPVETVTVSGARGRQWQESINSMVSRGAKGTDEELATILDYLSSAIRARDARRPPPAVTAGRRQARRRAAPTFRAPPISTWSTRLPPIAAAKSMPPSASTAMARTRAAPTTAPT